MATELCSRNRLPFLTFAAPDEGALGYGAVVPGSSPGRLPESVRESRWESASPGGAESSKVLSPSPTKGQELQGRAGRRRWLWLPGPCWQFLSRGREEDLRRTQAHLGPHEAQNSLHYRRLAGAGQGWGMGRKSGGSQ